LAILAGFIAVTYFYFPETRRLTIEEISHIFDAKDSKSAAETLQEHVANKHAGGGFDEAFKNDGEPMQIENVNISKT
jgi:hypothetical protein